MDYVQLTDQDRKKMLQVVSAGAVDDLYANLPKGCRLEGDLELQGLPRGLSELELTGELGRLARTNVSAAADAICFLGGGAYDHFIPAVVDSLASQGAFLTAYTPYQAEASQGSLQTFFEFQTQVCRLTGMDVANASLYEGSTAVAEAVLMAMNVTGKRRVVVASTLHPHYLEVIRTYLSGLDAELIELPSSTQTGNTEPDAIKAAMEQGGGQTACVVVQSPNVYGVIENWETLFAEAHKEDKTLAVAVFNPIGCGLLKRPGDCGADIAAGEGQPLASPMSYGGPYLGLFAAKQSLVRKMPGRLVGQTVDADGQRAFCLTLQTREQHIRGAKATSNVCTNQGLLALRASIYMNTVGPAGLREVAEGCYHKAHHAAEQITKLPGFSLAFDRPFFHEFVVDCPVPAARIIEAGAAETPVIMPGLDCGELGIGRKDQLLIAVTEKRTAADIDRLVGLLRDAGG